MWPINLDRNRGFGKWREISPWCHWPGDLENPDENWVLSPAAHSRPSSWEKEKKLSTAFSVVVEYVHICLD